jgi:hypothetical protein
MGVIAPPQPQQPLPDDLEALIEEARRRARRRRLAYVSAGVLVLAAGAGIAAAVFLVGGSSRSTAVPRGYHLVQARGPVSHALIERRLTNQPTVIDLASGRERPVVVSLEVWWDRRSGLERVVARNDGRAQFDVVGQSCQPAAAGLSGRFCVPPAPFELRQQGFSLPVDNRARVVSRGRVGGHDVVWLEGLVLNQPNAPGRPSGDRVALDAVTREPVEHRQSGRGRILSDERFTVLPDLPASRVSFAVPEGGATWGSFPPSPEAVTHVDAKGLNAASDALGTQPVWLGREFRGQPLRSVEVGTVGVKTRTGAMIRPARFVRLDYGTVTIQEFGKQRPYYYEHGPKPGTLVIEAGSGPVLQKDGLLVMVQSSQGIDRAAALTIARALRRAG